MTPIVIDGVSKRLGDALVVQGVDLEIGAGELFFLLGPSGCGKTTLLSLVAGLLEPTEGRILLGERDVTRLPTSKRNAVMCFQSYALWPHLSVAQNVEFGLKVQQVEPGERRRRVNEALALVQMGDYAARYPAQLSGGQQQRVAIARAVAVKPACLLLDEPLSNLDTRLRQQMRGELRRICKATGLTTVYVTHDQKEALSVADRIAIMRAGRVVQVGTPHQLYDQPQTSFVAEFLGQANLIAAHVRGQEQVAQADALAVHLRLDSEVGPLTANYAGPPLAEGEQVTLSIRPEQLRLASGVESSASEGNRVEAQVVESAFLGDCSEHRLEVSGRVLRLQSVPPRLDLPSRVLVELPASSLIVLRE